MDINKIHLREDRQHNTVSRTFWRYSLLYRNHRTLRRWALPVRNDSQTRRKYTVLVSESRTVWPEASLKDASRLETGKRRGGNAGYERDGF